MCRTGEERVHAHDAGRHLVVLITDERRLLQLHGDRLYILARVQRNDGKGVGTKGLAFRRHYHQLRIELGEHAFDQLAEPVHDR